MLGFAPSLGFLGKFGQDSESHLSFRGVVGIGVFSLLGGLKGRLHLQGPLARLRHSIRYDPTFLALSCCMDFMLRL